jgi:hypothetical protein
LVSSPLLGDLIDMCQAIFARLVKDERARRFRAMPSSQAARNAQCEELADWTKTAAEADVINAKHSKERWQRLLNLALAQVIRDRPGMQSDYHLARAAEDLRNALRTLEGDR